MGWMEDTPHVVFTSARRVAIQYDELMREKLPHVNGEFGWAGEVMLGRHQTTPGNHCWPGPCPWCWTSLPDFYRRFRKLEDVFLVVDPSVLGMVGVEGVEEVGKVAGWSSRRFHSYDRTYFEIPVSALSTMTELREPVEVLGSFRKHLLVRNLS